MHPIRRLYFGVSALLLCTGCAATSPLACPQQGNAPRPAKVYFATDRKRETNTGPDRLAFSGDRSDPPGLSLGWQKVNIGPRHRLGKADKPITTTSEFNVAESPGGQRAAALRRTDVESQAFIATTLRAAIRSAPAPRTGAKRQVILFIHGYNTTFDYAVRETAQLAADLELVTCNGQARGVPITYSWPAQGSVLSYLADEENAEWTQQRFEPFLQALAQVCRQEGANLQIIAHSMGARLLVRSLADIANSCAVNSRGERVTFNEIILLAPDIGKGLFDQYVERILPMIRHLTIYVSTRDRALALSNILHGGRGRLGLFESSLLAVLNLAGDLTGMSPDQRSIGYFPADSAGTQVDMIDVSGGIAGSFGHAYEDPRFIGDLRELIYNHTPAGTGGRSDLEFRQIQRGLFHNIPGRELRYFRLKTS